MVLNVFIWWQGWKKCYMKPCLLKTDPMHASPRASGAHGAVRNYTGRARVKLISRGIYGHLRDKTTIWMDPQEKKCLGFVFVLLVPAWLWSPLSFMRHPSSTSPCSTPQLFHSTSFLYPLIPALIPQALHPTLDKTARFPTMSQVARRPKTRLD